MSLPALVKVEAKFTTGTGVPLPGREREALRVDGLGQLGLVAALFLDGGDDDDEARWLLVDAAQIRERDAASVHLSRAALRQMSRLQPAPVDALRAHLDERFRRVLQGFLDEALAGHEALVTELAARHAVGTLGARLPQWHVLDCEHRANLAALVERHGESGAGRVLQDLLAYTLALAGYPNVVNNPVGVPDFVVSGLQAPSSSRVLVELRLDEARELAALCRRGGNDSLAAIVERSLSSRESGG
ncbi:MAG: hypothetical protein QM765_38935 [Myxococcales bacterium]